MAEPRHGDEDFEGTPVWVLYVASMVLVLLGGAFAGLTIAYVGSPLLRLLQRAGSHCSNAALWSC